MPSRPTCAICQFNDLGLIVKEQRALAHTDSEGPIDGLEESYVFLWMPNLGAVEDAIKVL